MRTDDSIGSWRERQNSHRVRRVRVRVMVRVGARVRARVRVRVRGEP